MCCHAPYLTTCFTTCLCVSVCCGDFRVWIWRRIGGWLATSSLLSLPLLTSSFFHLLLLHGRTGVPASFLSSFIFSVFLHFSPCKLAPLSDHLSRCRTDATPLQQTATAERCYHNKSDIVFSIHSFSSQL